MCFSLRHLARNAIKFSAGEGKTVTITLKADAAGFSMSVSDEGPGVPPDRLPGIFGEFAQSEAAAPASDRGVGLGLAVVKQNTELLGGKIHAENIQPCGLRFTVDFPAMVSS